MGKWLILFEAALSSFDPREKPDESLCPVERATHNRPVWDSGRLWDDQNHDLLTSIREVW